MDREHNELDNIAVCIANYKTADVTQRAYETFRAFYPDVLVYVVDNGSKDASTEYIREVAKKDHHAVAIFNSGNVGHGPAMHQVADVCGKKYLFTLDSDTITHTGGFLELMLAKMATGELVYAVGLEVETDKNGFNVYNGKGIRYIHPSAALYNLRIYKTLRPFIHHGAPCIENMIDANVRQLGLVDFPIKQYVEHLEGQTSQRVGGWSPNVVKTTPNKMPFLSFVTRCHKRPAQLLRCLAHIARQTDQDYENVIIVDEVGGGVLHANKLYALPENISRVRGDYVHLIDDDDIISDIDFVASIKDVVAAHDPDVIVIRVLHPCGVALPDKDVWMKPPVGGHIGGSSVVVRRDVWIKHIHRFGDENVYWGDFIFVEELFKPRYHHKIYWLNRIMVTVPRQNMGKTEYRQG